MDKTAQGFVDDTLEVERLAKLSAFDYEREREPVAEKLGVRVGTLDKLVYAARAKANKGHKDFLPHWNVEPWPDSVLGADLLNDLRAVFQKYIYAPAAVHDATALWVLHAWTIDAGDISPFFVLVSPTKRCGKTNMLIVLMYLTPRSELPSNISPSALFRYVEYIKPTLLIDEADSFVSASDELRGILNSGHTRVAANVIRNVEVNGEHLPKRFSAWAAKAIATIRDLADTLEDRSIVIQLQRKPRTAKVARLRKRDCSDFATLRQKAARWAEDNFDALAADPNPKIPDELNDRAADNWRPLLAIADLAGGDWPRRARDAACVLSGAGHEAMSVNVECLADIRLHLSQDMHSVDLVEALNADLERPWATWNKGKPLSQKQLANLLKPFLIVSESIWINGKSSKGYKRSSFEEAWAAYLPGQNDSAAPFAASETAKRQNADETGTSGIFSSGRQCRPAGSKNSNLSYSHAGSAALPDRNTKKGAASDSDQDLTLVCDHCGGPATPTSPVQLCSVDGEECRLHPDCQTDWLGSQRGNGATKFRSDIEDAHAELALREQPEDDLTIPPDLDRRPRCAPAALSATAGLTAPSVITISTTA